MHGTADKAITMGQFANRAVELEQAGVKHEMVTYSGAPHAFTVCRQQTLPQRSGHQILGPSQRLPETQAELSSSSLQYGRTPLRRRQGPESAPQPATPQR